MASSRPQRPRLDTTTPNMGRVADYFLGGKDNFAVDREAAEAALAITPELPALWREGRRFLGRAVRFLAQEAGIRQFVDIGCGLPTQGNVHEIAHSVAPDARVVYVDNDPMVVVHGQALLQDDRLTVVIEADVREPELLLSHPRLTEMIDLDEPVAILLFGVLQDIPDDALVLQISDHLRKAISPGSYMAISQPVSDLRPEATAKLAAFYQDEGAISGPRREGLRTKTEVERCFEGLDLVDPGVVYIPQWRPDGVVLHRPDSIWVVGGIGRKA
ncbi:SAM-dependent methyltransferase [Streptosporangium carneum]|uniref:SAM-dependent methyltransferase n=1 Tax=Streptosporangium carneum TaxID=47481 RepID=A0A9W6I9D3_9ACTN|nr:SAM-dependent methyltransferase [Streptosporangium carneum]GLK14197.1 hypothetical protein GCM10017600_76090 [Streptosporangium carneum]